MAREADEIAGVDAFLGAEFQGRRVAAHHPQRRMRLLHRLHREHRAVGLVVVAVEGERLLVAIGRAQVVHEFEGRRFAEIVVDAERREIARADAGHQAAFEPPAEHLIDDGDFLGEPQRMVQRHDESHGADAQPLGARAAADGVERGRRHPAFVAAGNGARRRS